MQIKLLVACEDESTSLGFSQLFVKQSSSDIATFTTDLAKLHAEAAAIRPDVLLLADAPGRDDQRKLLQPLLRVSPGTRVVFLCESCTSDLMLAFIRLGACGCLLTSDHPSLWAKAVRAVHNGDTWFGRSTLLLALRSLVDKVPAVRTRVEEGRLTPREEEIFDLIGRGLTNKEIARELQISDHTVKTHLHRVYVKLNQSGRYKALLSQPGRLSH
jgi:DNA-binding NarL/FixJ family response regulator